MRLDVRLPARPGAALQVPSVDPPPFAYALLHRDETYQGVPSRQAAPPISVAERFSKLHCGRCLKPLAALRLKAENKGATYWVCGDCDKKLRRRAAAGQRDSTEVWSCPSAAEGETESGCLCWSPVAKKPQQGGVKRKGGKGYTSPKKEKWIEKAYK